MKKFETLTIKLVITSPEELAALWCLCNSDSITSEAISKSREADKYFPQFGELPTPVGRLWSTVNKILEDFEIPYKKPKLKPHYFLKEIDGEQYLCDSTILMGEKYYPSIEAFNMKHPWQFTAKNVKPAEGGFKVIGKLSDIIKTEK